MKQMIRFLLGIVICLDLAGCAATPADPYTVEAMEAQQAKDEAAQRSKDQANLSFTQETGWSAVEAGLKVLSGVRP